MAGRYYILVLGLAVIAQTSCKKDPAVIGGDDDDDATVAWGLSIRPANPDCVASDRPLSDAAVELVEAFPDVRLSDAMTISQSDQSPGYWYIIEREGELRRFEDDPSATDAPLIMDIRDRVAYGSEAGLLGMALHPNFANNGDIYLYYTASGSPFVSRVSRFHSDDGGASFDPGSEEIVFAVDQPFSNHNGGTVAFGPDGYLYFSLGDGGSGGDPGNRAQDKHEFMGKMLRFDVDNGDPYSIPADNPYADGVDGLPEIFAYGLRNVFRFTFDSQNGELWAGDVGQNAWEEVDKVELGGNYGWRVTEGLHCYSPAVDCETAGLIDPIAEYPNSGASVIGGVVYYGSEIPEMHGTYLFIDYYEGDLLGVTYDQVTGEPSMVMLSENTGRNITAFATGLDGEAYALDQNDGLFRLERTDGATADPFPVRLSQTGCFEPDDPTTPTAGVIDYSLNQGFWSDGIPKERFLAIPDGTTISIDEDGDWILPVGSVLAKHFRVGGDLIETRLFMRHDDGEWGGYAYEWNGGQTDAILLPGGKILPSADQLWTVPTRAECVQCHGQAAGGSLGLETSQLNSIHTYASTGLNSNQISTLDHIGMFDVSPGEPDSLESMPTMDGSDSVEDRARAYLHINCSQCHRPDGAGRGEMDLRWSAADLMACDLAPEFGDLGVEEARIIAPGDPSSSVLSIRMRSRGAYGMPPVGTHLVDNDGATLVDTWISEMTGCP